MTFAEKNFFFFKFGVLLLLLTMFNNLKYWANMYLTSAVNRVPKDN